MEKRLTLPADTTHEKYRLPAGALARQADGSYIGAAVQRLASFENLVQDLQNRQPQLAAQLEALRAQGKKNSTRFKELLGQKLMESNTLVLLKTYGIE